MVSIWKTEGRQFPVVNSAGIFGSSARRQDYSYRGMQGIGVVRPEALADRTRHDVDASPRCQGHVRDLQR